MATSAREIDKGEGGTEGFYRDENGEKQDADFHDAILDNPKAEAFLLQRTRERCLANGMSQEDVDNAYGPG